MWDPIVLPVLSTGRAYGTIVHTPVPFIRTGTCSTHRDDSGIQIPGIDISRISNPTGIVQTDRKQ